MDRSYRHMSRDTIPYDNAKPSFVLAASVGQMPKISRCPTGQPTIGGHFGMDGMVSVHSDACSGSDFNQRVADPGVNNADQSFVRNSYRQRSQSLRLSPTDRSLSQNSLR